MGIATDTAYYTAYDTEHNPITNTAYDTEPNR